MQKEIHTSTFGWSMSVSPPGVGGGEKDELKKALEGVVYEAADLCFHSLVALAAHGIHPERVKAELARRFGLSGIEEKNSRKD